MKRKEGDTFELGGCLWIVDKAYISDNPELCYKDRITVRCIRNCPSNNVYQVGDILDYANA